MDKEQKAVRILQTFTGPWEKPALIKMAQALPAWVNSDHLTVLGIFSSFIIFGGLFLLWRSPWWIMLSNAGFVINWWADSLDGTLARVRHREREKFGHFVDHISDAFGTAIACTGLALSPLVHPGIGLAVALGYLLMNVYAHLLAYVDRVFKISYGRFGPTEVRIMFMAISTVFAFWNPRILTLKQTIFHFADTIFGGVAVVLVVIFVVSSIKKAIQLDREDRARWNVPGA